MKHEVNGSRVQNSAYIWIAPSTGALLLIPYVAMQLTSEVNWNVTDFIVMGSLIAGLTGGLVLVIQRAPRRYRMLVAGILIAAFAYVWAELAVGVLTNLGS